MFQKIRKKVLRADHETKGCIILGQTTLRFTICPQRKIFEKLYQDHLVVARMLHC